MKGDRHDAIEKLRRALAPEFTIPAVSEWSLDTDELDSSESEADAVAELRLVRSDIRLPLFDYQEDLVRQALASEHLNGLLALPTGAGKTRTAVAVVLAGLASGRFRHVVWLAPSVELVEQAFAAFRELWIMQGDLDAVHLTRNLEPSLEEPTVVLTTPQTVYSRRARLLRMRKRVVRDLIVFDEAHQLGAPTFVEAIESLGAAGMSGTQSLSNVCLLGLSATPGRVDPVETEDLVTLFRGRLLSSRLLGPNPVETLQRRGVLARLKFRRLTGSGIPADDEGRRILVAARACVELRQRDRKPLVFAATVPGALVLAEALRGRGLRAEALHAETPPARRQIVVSDFANGRIEVLVNHRLLATGYDCPAVSDVLILGPVGSPVLFEQIVGRAARGPKTGGSRVATVWDFDDHLKIHGLPNSYYRYRDYDWRSLTDSGSS